MRGSDEQNLAEGDGLRGEVKSSPEAWKSDRRPYNVKCSYNNEKNDENKE